MIDTIMGNTLWHLVTSSDWLSKTVLLTLFVMSVLCWTVFLCKIILFSLRKRDLHRMEKQLQSVGTIADLHTIAASAGYTLPGRFLTQSLFLFKTVQEMQLDTADRKWDVMQYHLEQITDRLLTDQETYLPVLSTSAAIATLLGLFGTVWGLIHAFISISERQSADITVVAPGIAAALLTTLAGLIVAIPALVMYNYLLNQVRKMEINIVHLADKVSFIMQYALMG